MWNIYPLDVCGMQNMIKLTLSSVNWTFSSFSLYPISTSSFQLVRSLRHSFKFNLLSSTDGHTINLTAVIAGNLYGLQDLLADSQAFNLRDAVWGSI